MTPAQIRALRKGRQLTQAAFAQSLCLRQATISNWETGRTQPGRMALLTIHLLQHAENMAGDLEALRRGYAPSSPALVEWNKWKDTWSA